MKAKTRDTAKQLVDIPNVGSATAKDLNLIGIRHPKDLTNKDPIDLFKQLCNKSGFEHDPCTADVFMSAVDFMNGKKAKPWWKYTATRKKLIS